MTSLDLDPPLVVGDITLVRFLDGHTYEDNLGRTYYSGAAEPSQADAEDCLLALRTPASPLASAAEIKAEAGRRIYAIAPQWKQANLTARVLELTRDHGPRAPGWPAEAIAEDDAAQVIWAKIKAIRAHSDALETNPPTVAGLATAGWPY